ncbi:hypothetical protein N7G274_008268 [Stereocaulon virgatum]|uniref:Uncharacterized protein n=1 Tax=Stereocaulon virgatum TaxID=373712 RepID=A0ABR4A1L2_9LECA
MGGTNATFVCATKLVFGIWPRHPKYGCETAMPHKTTKKRWKSCEGSPPYVEHLRTHISNASGYAKAKCGTYTLAALWNEVAWFYYELSKYTEARAFITFGHSICNGNLATPFAGPLSSEQRRAFLQLRVELERTRAIIACDIGDRQTALFYCRRQFFVMGCNWIRDRYRRSSRMLSTLLVRF